MAATRSAGGRGARGVVLLVRLDHERRRVEVLRATPASQRVWQELPEPRSVNDFIGEAPETTELVVAVHDEAGERIVAHALPPHAMSFFDRPHTQGTQESLEGHIVERHQDVRSLHLVLPPGAQRLAFSRRTLGRRGAAEPAGMTSEEYEPSYSLAAEPDRRPIAGLTPLPLQPRGKPGAPPPKPPSRAAQPPVGGTLANPVRVGGGGALPSSFNVVILGDGFQQSEQLVLRKQAKRVADGLLQGPPYKAFQENITFTLVPAVSPDSGITNCPFRPAPKTTYYGLEGYWDDTDVAGFYGTAYPERILDAAATVTALERVHLIIMLANSAMYGGRADPAMRLAYAAIQYPGKDLISFVAHESAHAFAKLGDEYIAGSPPPKKGIPFPNCAREADVDAGKAKWKHLAYDFELLPDGRFRAVHRLGDPTDRCNQRPIMPRGLERMLGGFWGSGYIDDPKAPEPPNTNSYDDPRGARYYRPMAVCKMRWLSEPFCRVCRATQAAAIKRAIPGEG